MIKASIKLGVCYWQDFPAKGNYYPDDLPQDWYLAYYANEFNLAVFNIPSAEDDQIELIDAISEAPDELDWWLRVASTSVYQNFNRLLEQEGLAPTALFIDTKQKMEPEIQNVIHSQVCFYSDKAWRPDNPSIAQAEMAFFNQPALLKQQRQWVEHWLETSNQNPSNRILLVDGRSYDYQQLHELQTLIELMGYSS